MPIYTYRCDNCGVQFDRQQHFDDPVLKKCPECGKLKLRKVFLPVGIVFKGSGFYATDHRSPSGQTSSRHEDSKSESKAKKESEDSKPSEGNED
ncbi:MAG: zinc ribbon domain-containing protein [Anaerolineales bacterium]|jgi:putative FmdB family regulatory protein